MLINTLKSQSGILILLTIYLFVIGCKESPKPNSTGDVLDNKVVHKELKDDSPLDEQKKNDSKKLTAEVIRQLNFVPNSDRFMAIFNRFKEHHLFVNADKEGYIIVAPTNDAFNAIPEQERTKLLDAQGNDPYKMKFLLHHIFPQPKNPYDGMKYRSLVGTEVGINTDRTFLALNKRNHRINSSLKVSDKLEIISVDQVLYQ